MSQTTRKIVITIDNIKGEDLNQFTNELDNFLECYMEELDYDEDDEVEYSTTLII